MADQEGVTKGIVEASADKEANGLNPLEGRRIFIGFGINDYDPDHFRPLNNAVRDVEVVAELLKDEYGFEIFTYTSKEDTTLQNINIKLNSLVPVKDTPLSDQELLITEKDSLILYFSGHGVFSPKLDATYFAPSNGQNITDDDSSLIDADRLINKILPKIPCFHLLLIIDCCFAGGFAKEGKQNSTSVQFGDEHSSSQPLSNTLFSKKSRRILTSGWLETVSDGAKGTHSPFAKALLTCLHNYYNLNFMSLVERIRSMAIGEKGGGMVISDTFDQANHNQGEFVFYRINDGRPNPTKLKQALLELNYKPQINEIRKPSLFNLYYLNGTELCGHHLFTHRFFMERKKKVNIFHAIPYTLRFGTQEGVRPFDDLWQVLARHFFNIEHEVVDAKNILDKLIEKLKSENCILILKVEKKFDDNKLATTLSQFWATLNKILIENKYMEPLHGNNFYLFILDRRGHEWYFDKTKIEKIIPESSPLAKLTCFSPILPINRTDDLEDWWDIHRNSIEEAKFQGILFNKFDTQEYITNAIEKLCDQCDRQECFEEIFLKQWIS